MSPQRGRLPEVWRGRGGTIRRPRGAARTVFEEGDIMLLEGKTAVITGAGRGIGQAIALALWRGLVYNCSGMGLESAAVVLKNWGLQTR